MKRIYLAIATVALFVLPAFGASTINPAVPAQNSPMASAPIRNNFAAAYNDVNNILTDFAGTSAPLNPSTNQSWMDTTVASAWKLKIYDGTTWVQLGTLDPTTHTFTYTASTVPLPTPSTLGGSFSKSAVSHFFLTGLGTDGVYTVAQAACADVSNAGTVCTKNTGKSVADPGTGALESMLPIQTVTGASKTYATADLQLMTRRSNAGSAMTDTFPASSATGMANGTRITVANVDATATDTITAGAGTSFTSGSTDVVEAGRDVSYVYDSTAAIWRRFANTGTGAIMAATGTNTAGHVVTMASIYGKVQDSGTALTSLVSGPASATSGNVPTFNGTTGKVLQDSGFSLTAIPLANLAQVGANTVLGNWGSTTGSVAAKSMPSCPDSGGQHLNYVSGTGVTCGTGGAGISNGMWTPTDASGAGLSFTCGGGSCVNKCTWVQVGKLVSVACQVTYPTTPDSSVAKIGGLPTASATFPSLYTGATIYGAGTIITAVAGGASYIQMYTTAASNVLNSGVSNSTVYLNITYQTP